MGSPGPTRDQGDLADMIEMLLDKGVVINADIAVSIGDTELLGVQVRAALASFETAAEYGLEFPEGTDMERVEEAAAGRSRRRVEGDADGDADSDSEEARVEVERRGDEETEEEAPEASSRNRVAVRPHATPGDAGGASSSTEEEERGDGETGGGETAEGEATEGDDDDG